MIQDRVQSDPPPFAGSKFRLNPEDNLSKHLLQVKAAAERYLRAQFGRVRLLVRNTLFLITFGLMVFLATAAFAVVAVVQICYGIAGGIGALLGGRPWAGELIFGLAVLGGTCTFCWVLFSRLKKSARQKALDNYLKSTTQSVETLHP